MKLNKKSVVWFIVGLIIVYFVIDFSINRDENIKDFKAGWKAGGESNKEINEISSQELNKRRSHYNNFFQMRSSDDLKHFSKNQLSDIERKYQLANRDLGSEKAANTLIELINNDEYNGANRIGCALQYLGQISDIDQQEKYLLRAKSDYSNSWYGDGVNVGAYATYKLALYYSYKNDVDNAKKYKSELLEKYSDHIDHRGNYFKDIMLSTEQ